MKKTDLYLKPGTYIKASTTQGEVQGTSLENFVVSVLNNPTCCPKPSFIKDGMLMTAAYLDTSLQTVTDQGPNSSPLKLSTLLVRVESALEIAERLRLEADSTVTTQTSSVIQATTTNANLVIAPNGTGAIVASIPDGTATGGNARGQYAIDLNLRRSASTQVAQGTGSIAIGGNNSSINTQSIAIGYNNTSGNSGSGYSVAIGSNCNAVPQYSVVIGTGCTSGDNGGIAIGNSSFATGYSVAIGSNVSASGYYSVSLGKSNSATSDYSVVSGGQSNTASTNTHATVVGGLSNTASGYCSIAGGQNATASGSRSIAFGESALALGSNSACLAGGSAQGAGSTALAGTGNNAISNYSLAQGYVTETRLLGQVAFSGTGYNFPFERGFCQQSLLTANRLATLNSAATTVLSLDGTGTTNLIIPYGNNRLWAVKVVATAFVSVAGGTLVLGDSYMGEFTMLFKRVGGTSSVVGVNSANLIYDTNMATAAFTFAAGASQDLQITFKAPTTASATTFRCVAKVELVEVAY